MSSEFGENHDREEKKKKRQKVRSKEFVVRSEEYRTFKFGVKSGKIKNKKESGFLSL